MTPCEVDEVSRSIDDCALFGCPDHGDAAAAAELEQALVAEGAESAEHGVGVHAEHCCEVFGGWEPFAGLGLAVCDRATDLSSGLLEEWRSAEVVKLACDNLCYL